MAARGVWTRKVNTIASRMGVPVRGGDAPQYLRKSDVIEVPTSRRGPARALTLLHELAHATEHPARLNRMVGRDSKIFGSKGYAREEVIAQLTADRVARRLGMPARLRHERRMPRTRESFTRAYVKEWLDEGFGPKPKVRERRGLYGIGPRTRAEATSIMKDVKAVENYIMSFAPSGKRTFRRGRPVRGGGA